MSSLFVAADDFSEMLEKNTSNKNHGTLGEIFNKDKASDRQMAWEDSKRPKNFHKKKFAKFNSKAKGGKKTFGKKNFSKKY